ncbi:MAG: sugar phosphate isomerase/epimerase [Spirochaetaceae bacterium]|nr:MAG: sugar phosphate isomerase/epimerase [Spirochaetaceae bacterium]
MKTVPVGLHAAVIPQADLRRGLKAASSAGFSAYEPEAARLSGYSRERLNGDNALRESLNLSWGPLNELQVFAPEPRYNSTLDLAVELDITALTLIPGSGSVSFDEAVEELRGLRENAGARGLSLYFEMLCFRDRPFHTVEQSLQLVEATGIKLVVDTFHFIASGAEPENIAKIPKEMIGVVHISDALTRGRSVSQIVDEDRVLPGEGVLDLVTTMEALRRTGYHGLMSVEVFHPKYAKEEPESVARQAYLRTEKLLKQSGWIHRSEDD